ncbi:MAG: pseudouridine synthase [Crocinitomicaceae bacterium]|nr:pseudouridine synthase [Crocinitomicaceae bacterium]
MSQSISHKIYFALYKPYGYLSQFSGESNDKLLGELYDFPKDVYSIGRLDKDSEGLILLTNDNRYKTQLLDPDSEKQKTYWVQVEGDISDRALFELQEGTITIAHKGRNHRVKKAICEKMDPPIIPDREPAIRARVNIPTSWIQISITEGKNRQVRKMTAAVGFPTLRLIRVSFDNQELKDLEPGQVREYQP